MSSVAALTHAQKVVRLYRKSLKSLRDYTEDYDWFLSNAQDLRTVLKSRKMETNPFLIQKYMKEFETFTTYWEHPDPYVHS
eukprot:gene3723-4292_t